mmetsp:Transcript_81385/g.226683  ORF Transcript_81385/g.226683 Transcript_81385/m.226683 type:complete len:233 (+) Transcript_81385:97-795(+)|eukprot:CAMPEP_0117551996 /NCGR_PEP_ID=MMETSP0784-20121206/49482_1 /TAXON_ID=39447 /ORGANISM="" /LENGTH=232 /DNA_ID=CAMNT_0005349059 /DNA_START=84 /DNA_END=782 /DNA_ORIENTATION=+
MAATGSCLRFGPGANGDDSQRRPNVGEARKRHVGLMPRILAGLALFTAARSIGGVGMTFLAGGGLPAATGGALRKPGATALRAAAAVDEVKPKLPTQLDGLSEEELAKRKAKALDIWDGMKLDIKDEMERYQTFRLDKFEAFMKNDARGIELMKLYKPGTAEYAQFFEEHMGPYVFEIAKTKLSEGLSQALGVVLVVGGLVAFFGYFGTDIIQFITSPFSGFANEFVQLYGF